MPYENEYELEYEPEPYEHGDEWEPDESPGVEWLENWDEPYENERHEDDEPYDDDDDDERDEAFYQSERDAKRDVGTMLGFIFFSMMD